MVAKTFIGLGECQDYVCGLEKCGINNQVGLCAKVYSEPAHIACLAVGKDKGFDPKRMWLSPNVLPKAGTTLEADHCLVHSYTLSWLEGHFESWTEEVKKCLDFGVAWTTGAGDWITQVQVKICLVT